MKFSESKTPAARRMREALESARGEHGADLVEQAPHLRVRLLEAKRSLEALAEKLGINLARDALPPPELPVANFDALDLLGEVGHGSDENGES